MEGPGWASHEVSTLIPSILCANLLSSFSTLMPYKTAGSKAFLGDALVASNDLMICYYTKSQSDMFGRKEGGKRNLVIPFVSESE